MKKILRQGNIKKYRAMCSCCDTEFEYQASDLLFVKSLNEIVVECPSCGILIKHKGNPSTNLTTEHI